MELDKNECQIKKYRERYSEPVKAVWGRHGSGGDLSVEEIQDYLSGQMSSLSPQIEKNVKHLMKLIKYGLDRSYKVQELIGEGGEFLKSFENPDIQEAAFRLLTVAKEAGATLESLGNGVIIKAKCSPVGGGRVRVAWIYPPDRPGQSNLKNLRDFSFGARKDTLSNLTHPKLQVILEQWIEEWRNSKDFHAECVMNRDYTAYSVNPNDAVKYIDFIEDRLQEVIMKVSKLQ